ncbi:MAG TPA: WXG100 family type VII secretion target [Bacilli bacterium]|nr:WXG100 family type VII secretion target [Bacilli bacterium]
MADFSANTENIYNVAQDAATKSKEYNQDLVDFYAKVDALGSFWQGTDYDVFREKAYSHKKNLEVAGETLQKYSELLNNAAASIDETSAEVQKYMNENF